MTSEIGMRLRELMNDLQAQIDDLVERRAAIGAAWRAMDLDALVDLGALTPREREQLEAELDKEPRGNPHMPRHPRPRGPRGGTSEPQSILLPEDEFTAAQAKAWVKRHGFKVGGYEAPSDRHGGRGAYHRFRQFDPDRRHSYRTIPFGKQGVMAVLEVPKRK